MATAVWIGSLLTPSPSSRCARGARRAPASSTRSRCAGGYAATLAPLFDDQELDARASVGTMYWEGAVRASGTTAGRGYLELTGYAGALKL